jgi:hypothetical protein
VIARELDRIRGLSLVSFYDFLPVLDLSLILSRFVQEFVALSTNENLVSPSPRFVSSFFLNSPFVISLLVVCCLAVHLALRNRQPNLALRNRQPNLVLRNR